jgi:2-hydroxychromene-2-carboxylate isomerase
MSSIGFSVIHFSDPGCPWAYSASPALAVLRWRYGDQLDWRLVTIGLTETADQYEQRGYTPALMARGYRSFRRHGMPFSTQPRRRVPATSRACRAIVATRLRDPEREYEVFRALQFGWFTTDLVLDEDDDIERAIAQVPGLDADAIVGAIDDSDVVEAYEADRAQARTATGGPTEFQGKAANSVGAVRYTAPSLIFELDGRRLEAGGFQPVEAYDVLVGNLDVSLHREPAPESPLPILTRSAWGLTTQEVAAVMASGNAAPDRPAAEDALIELVAAGEATRVPLGDDALWLAGAAADRALAATQSGHAVR